MRGEIRVEQTFPGWGGYKDAQGRLATTQLVMQGNVYMGRVCPRGTHSFGSPLKDSELIHPPNLPDILHNLEGCGHVIHESVWHVIQAALGVTRS